MAGNEPAKETVKTETILMSQQCSIEGVPFGKDEHVADRDAKGVVTLVGKALDDENIGVGNIQARFKRGLVYVKGSGKPKALTDYKLMNKDQVTAIVVKRKLKAKTPDFNDQVAALQADDEKNKK